MQGYKVIQHISPIEKEKITALVNFIKMIKIVIFR